MAVRSFPWQDGKFETQLRRKDGTLIEVLIRSMPEVDAQGELARYRSVALDLTELRARGDELERMNQRLRLINTELEDFTHVVSHDLKEPLRTLQAYSHILHEEYGALIGPDGFQYINHLIRASRRLGTLIDELLQLSQAGRITRAAGTFNLIEIVATVRQDLANLLEREKAALVTEGSLPDLVGDPVRITQLLTNLVANGLKYNQSEAPQVAIGAQPCADDPARVTIHVRDNGIGIDPAYHQQIFGIFRRLHKSDEYEGTGAGLAICKKIVEGHGGRIWVESQAGQGATFFFTLPCLPADRAAARNATVLGQERKSDTPSSATRRLSLPEVVNGAAPPPHIVLVEDQADIGMIIQKLGKRDGLVITWFPTAEEAWNQLQKMRPDLLLLDVNLPGMSGIELCQRIRTLAHLRDVPVAIFTPEQEPEQLQELRNAGADFFLTKDFLCQPTLWQQKLQELLNACGTHEPATSRADA
jgi:signal transduction histidine kinase